MTSELTLANFAASVPVMSGGNTAYAARYARELREVAIRQAHRSPRSVQRSLGPSELGHQCHRLVVGKMSGQQVTNHVADPWPSIVGTAVHAQLAEYFGKENAAYAQQRWITEARVAANVLLANPGTADLYDGHEFNLVDHKVLGPTTMAKVMSAAGPPWHYVIQMLIYAQGYRDFGYRVDRVILAAWPRTAPTLDSMYCWERPYVPAADDDLLRQVAAITAARREVASRVMAGRIPIEAVPRTPGDECFYCFRGDTEVVTRDGIKPIRELAGTEPELLVPDTGPESALKSRGSFRKTEVRSFGQQRLWRIRLRNHGAVKDIYATAEHRWMLELRRSRANPDNKHGRVIRKLPAERFERVTSQLQPGDRLRPLRIHSAPDRGLAWVPDAIARGFVYGDGSVPAGSTEAEVSFLDRSNGKYEALMPFFRDHQDRVNVGQTATGDTRRRIRQLPANGKQLPDLSLPPDFLLSWLAGYFAADGNVSPEGRVTLSSAREDNIRYARDTAAICGVGYGPVRFTWRTGYGTEPSQLWSISLRRRDLPDWFLIRPQHLTNAIKASEARPREFCWSVESVTRTDQVEEVFCAVVPGVGAFGLADSIMTSNCPWFRPQSARDGGPGCPGHSAKN